MGQQFTDIDFALAKLLLDRALNNSGTITYGDCAKQLSQTLGRPVNAHFGLTNPLWNVANLCFDLDLPILTAYVIRQNNPNATGEGFYKMICDFRPESRNMTPVESWKAELNRVRRCTDWSPLSSFLSKHV